MSCPDCTAAQTHQHHAGLREVLGERVYDRLTETARIVTFEGESYRLRARREAA